MNLPTNVTEVFYKLHEPFQISSWIFQTNFVDIFALYGFRILNFSPSHSRSLTSHCSLIPLCYAFTWKPLALTPIFLSSFITIPQSWKQALPFWSLIIVHRLPCLMEWTPKSRNMVALMMMYKQSLQTWSEVGYEKSIKILVNLVVGSD